MCAFIDVTPLWLTFVEDGEAYTCGINEDGQLGNPKLAPPSAPPSGAGGVGDLVSAPDPSPYPDPVRVQALDLYKVHHTAAGQSHAIAVTEQVSV